MKEIIIWCVEYSFIRMLTRSLTARAAVFLSWYACIVRSYWALIGYKNNKSQGMCYTCCALNSWLTWVDSKFGENRAKSWWPAVRYTPFLLVKRKVLNGLPVQKANALRMIWRGSLPVVDRGFFFDSMCVVIKHYFPLLFRLGQRPAMLFEYDTTSECRSSLCNALWSKLG
jgi:hypothetical protein